MCVRLCLTTSAKLCLSTLLAVFSDSDTMCDGRYVSFLLNPRYLTPSVYTSASARAGEHGFVLAELPDEEGLRSGGRVEKVAAWKRVNESWEDSEDSDDWRDSRRRTRETRPLDEFDGRRAVMSKSRRGCRSQRYVLPCPADRGSSTDISSPRGSHSPSRCRSSRRPALSGSRRTRVRSEA